MKWKKIGYTKYNNINYQLIEGFISCFVPLITHCTPLLTIVPRSTSLEFFYNKTAAIEEDYYYVSWNS